jgi:hypothetical protein
LPEHRITGKHLTAKEIRAKHNVEQIVDIEWTTKMN